LSGIKLLGPKQGYVEILNFFTQQSLDEQSQQPRKYNPLRPSSAGKDARELAYEYMEFKGYAQYSTEAFDPETHRLLKLGHAVEKHVIWELKDALQAAGGDIEIRYQQQVLSFFTLPDGTKVEGSCDLVLMSRSKKFGGCLADVKSKKDKFSQFFKTDWDATSDKLSNMKTVQVFGQDSYWVEDLEAFLQELDDYFFSMNFKQLNMYFYDEHEFLQTRGVDHCAILQYNKNDSRLREIRFKPSRTVFEQVRDKFSMVQKIVDETKDPQQVPRENILGSAAVAFSKYRSIDYPDANALKEYFNTLPKKHWPKDTDRLSSGQSLDELFEQFEAALKAADEADRLEQKIVALLEQEQVKKVKTSNGNVYQMKYLKTGGVAGKGALVVRRSKI
jgi:hypothetical protein